MSTDDVTRVGPDRSRWIETPYQLLLDTLPFSVCVSSPAGDVEHYNQHFVDYLGMRPTAGLAARTAPLHPEDQACWVTALQSAVRTSSEYVVEARILRHDGVYRWHRIHDKPLIRSGILESWLGTAVDIHDVVQSNELIEQRVKDRTAELESANRQLLVEIAQRKWTEADLRATEARYRLLYNRTPIALQSVDAKAKLIDVNDTWLALFEYGRDHVIGRSPAEFMTPQSAEQYRTNAWPEMLASKGQLRVVDYQFVTRSGRVFDGRLSASGDFDAEGRFIRSWSAIADVTAEKRAARELRQAQRMEAIGQLTAGIAHDFNNLLTAILGNLELLSSRPSTNQTRNERLVAGARNAAERGAKLTAQLLAFARKQHIETEPVDVAQLIQGMMPLLRSSLGTIGIHLESDPATCAALADPAQLELAILNLVINARDAMPDGGMISIETANATCGEPTSPEEPSAGAYVVVRVTDTGLGIDADVRDRMFEPFFTTKGIGKGSGLGLSQVFGVSKQLGGGLTVRSDPNEGTTISIYLPQADAPVSAAATLDGGHEAGSAEGKQILLVDDDADVRSMAAAILTDAGYQVVETSSGASGLETLERIHSRTDLVIADVVMPGLNGVEFAAIVRRTWPALPIVLMTGYADNALLRLAAGHEVLRKPFQAVDLNGMVKRAMAEAKARSAGADFNLGRESHSQTTA